MSQARSNRALIVAGWLLVVISTLGTAVTLGLRWTGALGEDGMNTITNVLSWAAMVAVGADFLLSAYTKRNVDES